jgi:uncharacterized membrane protein YfcA
VPLGLSPQAVVLLGLALFVAAFVRGYAGFGLSAVFLASASLVTDPRPLIPVIFGCEILMTLAQLRGVRGRIDWHLTASLLAGAALALPFAVAAMARVGPETARLAISGAIAAASLAQLAGWRLARAPGPAGRIGAGAVSGLANAVGVGGLPVALLLSALPLTPTVFRATMIAYLTGLDLISLPVMGMNGLVTPGTAGAVLIALPVLMTGGLLGGRHFLSAPPEQFRKAVMLLLLALSVLGAARALA